MPESRIEEIEARLAAADQGQWRMDDTVLGTYILSGGYGKVWPIIAKCSHEPDADLIANAPADLRWLTSEVRRLREALSEITRVTGLADAQAGPYSRSQIAHGLALRAITPTGDAG